MGMNERVKEGLFKNFIGKTIKLVVNINNRDLYYSGKLKSVSEKFLLLEEIKEGELIINLKDIKQLRQFSWGGK